MTRALVLLASYNGAAWIEEQISSILGQHGVEVHVVVGDDASTDRTQALIAARFGNDQRVRLIPSARPSGSAGANFLRLIRSVDVDGFDVVALSDQDDVWFPGKLASAVTALASGGAVGYSAAVRARWSDGREAVLKQNDHLRRADFLFEGAGQGCTFVMTRAFLKRVQGFLSSPRGAAAATMHFHDWFLYLLSRTWGERWIFDPIPCMDYRQHDGNEIGARGGVGGLKRRLNRIRDGWYAQQISQASAVYRAAGGTDPAVLRLVDSLDRRGRRSVAESMTLAWRLLAGGRRRFADRAILCAAALAGWI